MSALPALKNNPIEHVTELEYWVYQGFILPNYQQEKINNNDESYQ